jgi:hypothetical protein
MPVTLNHTIVHAYGSGGLTAKHVNPLLMNE